MKMNELAKTVTFVAVAVLLTGAAVVTTRDRTVRSETFNDQGQPFFPDFKDPLACTNLEVVEFDPSTATSNRFQVMFKDNKWVIPSHYDYPADARDRLSKTAAAVMDLVKDTIRSDRVEDQEELGVVDPLDTSTSTLKGRGKRITLRGASENPLADFIIGNEIKDKTGQRFVRVPGQKRTYGVKVKAEPSTRFADWIETNLLKLEAGRIRRIDFDNYKVRFDQGYRGEVVRGEVLTIERKDSSANWTLAGLPADQELDSDKLRTLTDALADLKIVGIRAKPAGLTRDLKSSDASGIKLTTTAALSLQSKGFYVTREGLLSNQGDVRVYTDEGIIYTLRFGEVVVGSGDELTAGTRDDTEKKADEKGAAKDKEKEKAKAAEGSGINRFVMVTASFDPSLIPTPKTEDEKETGKPVVQPGQPLEIPANPFAADPNDPKVLADQKAAKEKAEQDKKDYEKKLADGEKRAQELTNRFAAWYYVSPGESFRSINLDRAALVRPKKADAASNPAGGLPPFPGSTPSLPNTLPPIQP
jgi:hypothetical protein